MADTATKLASLWDSGIDKPSMSVNKPSMASTEMTVAVTVRKGPIKIDPSVYVLGSFPQSLVPPL